MAALPTAARRDIEAFCAQLPRYGIRPQRVILFGSYARGQQHEGSDIDLIVVSRSFRGKGFLRRLEMLGGAAGDALVPVQARAYTPEEFATPDSGSFLEAIMSEKTIEIPIGRAQKARKPTRRARRRPAAA
jgi:predicted nucleotidyltransferase